ncbi:MAG: AAA family ATPase [Pseudomonadota bacterium]
MDHLAYYELKEEPFSVVPLTNFYYHNDQHDQAFIRLMRSVEAMKGLAVLVGEIGTGKTLLARRLLEALPEEKYEVSMLVVLHTDVTSEWLVKRVAAQFGVEDTGGGKVDIIGRLYERLNRISEEGRRAVIIVDEAHMLKNRQVLEEVRGLLNLELAASKLISFVMFGMPELDGCLSLDPALKQRTAVRYELKNFSPEVVSDYVRFRLFHAGSSQNIFSAEALRRIYELSLGNPRLVNIIADNSLFEGFVRKVPIPIGAEIVDGVGQDLGIGMQALLDDVADRR